MRCPPKTHACTHCIQAQTPWIMVDLACFRFGWYSSIIEKFLWSIVCICGATHLCVTSQCPYQSWQSLFLHRGYMLGARTKCTATLFTHPSASWMMLVNSRTLEVPCDISKKSFCGRRSWAKSTPARLWHFPALPLTGKSSGMCLLHTVPSWEQGKLYSQFTLWKWSCALIESTKHFGTCTC